MREPPLNAISQSARHHLGILGESIGSIARDPASAILQGYGQVPVIERSKRTDAPGEQGIDQAVIKIQAALIDRPGALWEDARPGERKAICAQVEFSHERNIFFHTVIMIRRDLARLAQV